MKKIVIGLLALLILAGCGTNKVTKTFELVEEEDGVTYTYLETYSANRDVVTKGTTVATIMFNEADEEYIEFMKIILSEQKACPYGIADESGSITLGCSEYIDSDFTFDEATSTFTITEVIHYDKAEKNKEDIYTEEAGGSYSENEFYSMEMFEADLLAAGYVEVK